MIIAVKMDSGLVIPSLINYKTPNVGALLLLDSSNFVAFEPQKVLVHS